MEPSERVTWEDCPNCRRAAAVGWVNGHLVAPGDPHAIRAGTDHTVPGEQHRIQHSRRRGLDFERHDRVFLADMIAHLKANKIEVKELAYSLGRKLTLEPAAERFIDDNAANALLTREYRAGFVVPNKV